MQLVDVLVLAALGVAATAIAVGSMLGRPDPADARDETLDAVAWPIVEDTAPELTPAIVEALWVEYADQFEQSYADADREERLRIAEAIAAELRDVDVDRYTDLYLIPDGAA